MNDWIMPHPRTVLIIYVSGCYIGGLCARFESGVSADVLVVFKILFVFFFNEYQGHIMSYKKSIFSSTKTCVFFSLNRPIAYVLP